MKFGVLYVKEGQRHENEMFQNGIRHVLWFCPHFVLSGGFSGI